MPEQHVVSVSSGMGSAFLWKLVLEDHPEAVAVFADVNGEDPDNYRFLNEVHEALGRPTLAWLDNDGRTIWDTFREARFLGNDRTDICSRELKRKPIEAWLRANCDPDNTVLHIGIDWTEEQRIPAIRDGWARLGWRTEFRLSHRNLDKWAAWSWLETIGVEPPELTREGFPHANCKGGCVRAGHGQWAYLYVNRPEVFAEWEAEEQKFREFLNRDDIALTTDRRGGGKRKPMTLATLRERVDAGEIKPKLSDGACRCLDFELDPPAEETAVEIAPPKETKVSPVLAAYPWRTNAEMIEACVQLGYLKPEWRTLDPTYGRGKWWTTWRPIELVASDLETLDESVNFTALPHEDNSFDVVCFDPPYVAPGGRASSTIKEFHGAYGTYKVPKTPQELQQLINAGLAECARVVVPGGKDGPGYILVKCMDYISSGRLQMASFWTQMAGIDLGLEVVDRLEHLSGVGPQPTKNLDGSPRRQVHARRNHSTLIVFKKPARRARP